MRQFEPPKPAINFPNGIQHKEHPVTNLDLTKAIEAGAKALPGVPANDEEVRLMQNTARAVIAAALPHLRAMIAQEILERLPESGPHINMTQYREGILDGMNRAIRIAKGPQQ